VYHGTKAFVTSFTEAVREETKDSGVTTTILEPGVTDTDFFNKADMERAKLVAEGPKADPAKVAKDGYDALMAGQDKIISGFMNKAQAALGHVLPDSTVAAIMHKQAEPVDGNESARYLLLTACPIIESPAQWPGFLLTLGRFIQLTRRESSRLAACQPATTFAGTARL
jgi:NAD(P)-dependent dehydrogenase (short-subunit alcohol dehydrogenase family)